jgi:CDP-diacylglycerol---serine O-phosphatidyltransferase
MPKLNFQPPWLKPGDPRPRRAAYLLPTLFTAGNLFLGYLAVLKAFQGAMLVDSGALDSNPHFELSAKAIGVAVLLDGLDGRIARLTNTVSEFGREIDSLADVITFGVAPAVLAFAWGVQFVSVADSPFRGDQFHRLGYFITFLFALCGAVRLARFNITSNPMPKNPGRPGRKYFVGLPIPAAAAFVAAVVYVMDSAPLLNWLSGLTWLAGLAVLAFLMVSTWRYVSFKDVSLLRPRSSLWLVALAALIGAIWVYPQPVLMTMAVAYVSSGVITRLAGLLKRRFRRQPPSSEPQPNAT